MWPLLRAVMSRVVLQVILGIEERDRHCLSTDHIQHCACNQMMRVKRRREQKHKENHGGRTQLMLTF